MASQAQYKLTPAERKPRRKKMNMNLYISVEAIKMLTELGQSAGLCPSNIAEVAIRDLYRKRGGLTGGGMLTMLKDSAGSNSDGYEFPT